MIARYAIGVVALIAAAPALAETLDAVAAQRFVQKEGEMAPNVNQSFRKNCTWGQVLG